jgi:hypothetical protein
VQAVAVADGGRRGEGPEVQGVEVGRSPQCGVGGVEDLEAAVAAEAVDDVRRDPAARPVRSLQHHHVQPAPAQDLRRAQPGQPGPDHRDVMRLPGHLRPGPGPQPVPRRGRVPEPVAAASSFAGTMRWP